MSRAQLGDNAFQTADGKTISPDSIADGSGSVGSLSGRPTLIIRRQDRLIAYHAVCSHLGCIVRWNASDGVIVCPCHGGEFDLQGAVTAGPPPEGLEQVSLNVVDDRIYRA